MRRLSLNLNLSATLVVDDHFRFSQLDQIVHEDIRPVSHTALVDVVDYKVCDYIVGFLPKEQEKEKEKSVVTIQTADDMHEELFEALKAHEDHTLKVDRGNKAVTLRCADCNKSVILVEAPIIEFSRCVKITIHGKANTMDIDDDGDIERAITEQLQNGLKIEVESTVDGIDIDDSEIDEVRPG